MSSDDDTPDFEYPEKGHVFREGDIIFMIDDNQYDIYTIKIMRKKKNIYDIIYPDYPDERCTVEGTERFLMQTERNLSIFEEQEKKRIEKEEKEQKKREKMAFLKLLDSEENERIVKKMKKVRKIKKSDIKPDEIKRKEVKVEEKRETTDDETDDSIRDASKHLNEAKKIIKKKNDEHSEEKRFSLKEKKYKNMIKALCSCTQSLMRALLKDADLNPDEFLDSGD